MTVVANLHATEDQEDGEGGTLKMYRATKPVLQDTGFSRIPCGVCPVSGLKVHVLNLRSVFVMWLLLWQLQWVNVRAFTSNKCSIYWEGLVKVLTPSSQDVGIFSHPCWKEFTLILREKWEVCTCSSSPSWLFCALFLFQLAVNLKAYCKSHSVSKWFYMAKCCWVGSLAPRLVWEWDTGSTPAGRVVIGRTSLAHFHWVSCTDVLSTY